MHQILFKRIFRSSDAAKTENMQHLEEKIWSVKKIGIKKFRKKKEIA